MNPDVPAGVERPYKVGDEVWVLGGGRRAADRAVIEKIGRKLVHIKRYGTYRIDDQKATSGYSSCFRTMAQYEQELRRQSVLDHLRLTHGITVEWRQERTYTTDRLERLLAFLNEEADGGH